ncbi:MAG: 16S rRNA (guanine(527)-N(7))-methyltransferase RsmG [Actinomycetota bacterium]
MPLSGSQIERLIAYVRLIEKWNATYNLTAIRDPLAMVSHHLLDCLAAAEALLRRRGHPGVERVLDVGSGAGLPGIVIAVVAPEREVVCIDSVGKKAAFITQAAASLGLKNVVARHERVGNVRGQHFDVIASRAFASLRAFVVETRHLLADEGVWMAMKGKVPQAELAELSGVTFHVEPLQIPELGADRCVIWLAPASGEASARL